MEIGAPEITGGGAVGLGTIVVWQLMRLVSKIQVYFEGMEKHRQAMEGKLDELIAGVRAIGPAPRFVEPTTTPVKHLLPEMRQQQ